MSGRISEHWTYVHIGLISAVATIVNGVTGSRELTIGAVIVTAVAGIAWARVSVFSTGLRDFIAEFAPHQTADVIKLVSKGA